MLVHQFLERSANRHPDKIAVVHDDERITYGQLGKQVESVSGHLVRHGIAKGDRVALLLENSSAYIIAYYAILKAGAVAAPLNPGLKPDGLQILFDDLAPSAVIADFKSERLLKAIDLGRSALKVIVLHKPQQRWGPFTFPVLTLQEGLSDCGRTIFPSDIDSTDLASIIYTSGSTGQSKGVMLSHGNIVSNTQAICEYLMLTPSDIQMVVLPFFYVMGKSLLNTHIAAGGTIVINNRFLYPADVIKQMIDEQVTGFSGVPSTYAYLLNKSPLASSRDKLTALRYCTQAGGHMAANLKRALRQTLPDHTRIYIMYGATEASARLTYLEPEHFEDKIDSIGKPIPNVTIRIMDDQGRQVPDGIEGELVASGPNIMQGYWKDPRDTARVLSEHGYHTGDIGYRGPDGFLYVLRRKDGLLKVGGHRINPVEIEEFFMSTDLVIEVAVVAMTDQLLGRKMVVLAVPKEVTCSSKSLMGKCAACLPSHKCPTDIVLVRMLPKNASGKIDREKCIEMAAAKSSRNQHKLQ
jgi:acyl-CoA synthetase (AMP-forming)/AMP-acid ligase II